MIYIFIISYAINEHVQVVCLITIADDCPLMALQTKVTQYNTLRAKDKPHQS